MDYRNDKFQIGDIVRLISDHNVLGVLIKQLEKVILIQAADGMKNIFGLNIILKMD